MQEQTYHGIRFGMAIQLAYQNYANCKGRSRRSEYWFFHFFICLVILGYFVIIRISNILFLLSSDKETYITYEYILMYIFCLVSIIPHISLTIRRLHDIGKSGAFIFLYFIPVVGILIILFFSCIDSKKDTNEYGPSPKYILPQNVPFNPNINDSGVAVPVNPYPQARPIPQVSPYPQPNQLPSHVSPNPHDNQIAFQENTYPQSKPMPPKVSPDPQSNKLAAPLNPDPQVSPNQQIPPP